jgi:hypothetical protein
VPELFENASNGGTASQKPALFDFSRNSDPVIAQVKIAR